MLLFLFVLFVFLGTAAGDFFCPNLSTLSKLFHLSENVTGLTFLALGNGAPDLFTTFTAMQQHKYNLALGELMGAASFITTVVVGSVAITTGFQVTRRPFLRDIAFFLGAMTTLLVVLHDGKITLGESVFLIFYYVAYVTTVILGRYVYQKKKRQRLRQFQINQEQRRLLAEEGGENALIEEAGRQLLGGNDTTSPISAAIHSNAGQVEAADRFLFSSEEAAENQYGPWFFKYKTFTSTARGTRRRPTLTEVSPLSATSPSGNLRSNNDNTWRPMRQPTEGTFENVVTLDSQRRFRPLDDFGNLRTLALVPTSATSTQDNQLVHLDTFMTSQTPPREKRPVPPVPATPQKRVSSPVASPEMSVQDESLLRLPSATPPVPRLLQFIPYMDRVYPKLAQMFLTLFPVFGDGPIRTWPEAVLAFFSIPAVFLLTLTIPVVDLEKDADMDKLREIEREIMLARYGVKSALNETTADDPTSSSSLPTDPSSFFLESLDQHLLRLYPPWNRLLLAVHCFMAPYFLLMGTGMLNLVSGIVTLFVSVALVAAVLTTTVDDRRPGYYRLLCFAGFPTAVTWIYLIANEVVALLLSLGLMLDVSEAILGLTIFAMGNSLPDLVANITVARMGFPNMAVAACFGGPMLNLLLGIGSSSFYYTVHNQKDYPLEFTPTLITSASGLIAALLISTAMIPWNYWRGTRLYGLTLLGVYGVIMVVNVLVETLA